MSLAHSSIRTIQLDQFRLARQIIQHEADALNRLAANLPAGFDDAVDCLCQCTGAVMVSGIGKAGWIAQKVSATLASTGTRSHYLHPSEAMHGDLGRIGPEDMMLVFSNSGETGEVLQLLPTLAKLAIPVISITGPENNTLAGAATIALSYGKVSEACPLGLAPSTTTTLMLALGDALALVASSRKGFRAMDFAAHHPGGSLGKRLSTVNEIMRPVEDCRIAGDNGTVRETFIAVQGPGRRTGAVLLVNDDGMLTGIFTDSDLARLLEQQKDDQLDRRVCEVMSANPKTVLSGSQTTLAVEMLACQHISELPVVDSRGRPLGIIDITDVLGLLPRK